jgi:hypothetical protein
MLAVLKLLLAIAQALPALAKLAELLKGTIDEQSAKREKAEKDARNKAAIEAARGKP